MFTQDIRWVALAGNMIDGSNASRDSFSNSMP
jgi:hypothetical protein